MLLHISPAEGKAIYRQIVDQVKFLVAARRLSPGDELPTVRGLAQQLLINPNTVARAYRELETAGVLYKRQGAGTYVSDGGSPLAEREQQRVLKERVDALVVETLHMNYGLDELIGLIKARHKTLTTPDKEPSE